MLTSPRNPRVKRAMLLRQARHRERQGRFTIDGARETARAVEAGVRLEEVFVCRELLDSEAAATVDRLAEENADILVEVSAAVFAKLAFGERSEGIVAVAVTPRRSLDDISLPGRPLVVVLEGVEKPGNVGAVLRTADAAGASAVVVAEGGTDLYNPNVIRASLGAIFTLPVVTATVSDTIAWLGRRGVPIYAARVDGSVPYDTADYTSPCALVLGSESSGLSDLWSRPGVTSIGLPMRGRVDSLNVSATAAVLMYEAVRQRAAGPAEASGGG